MRFRASIIRITCLYTIFFCIYRANLQIYFRLDNLGQLRTNFYLDIYSFLFIQAVYIHDFTFLASNC